MDDDENPVEIRTALALAKLWDDPEKNNFDCPWDWRKGKMNENYDDDYTAEAHLDRKAEEGWTVCGECGEWIHLNDAFEGVRCKCGEKEDAETDEG
jgi:hypothetical protein